MSVFILAALAVAVERADAVFVPLLSVESDSVADLSSFVDAGGVNAVVQTLSLSFATSADVYTFQPASMFPQKQELPLTDPTGESVVGAASINSTEAVVVLDRRLNDPDAPAHVRIYSRVAGVFRFNQTLKRSFKGYSGPYAIISPTGAFLLLFCSDCAPDGLSAGAVLYPRLQIDSKVATLRLR